MDGVVSKVAELYVKYSSAEFDHLSFPAKREWSKSCPRPPYVLSSLFRKETPCALKESRISGIFDASSPADYLSKPLESRTGKPSRHFDDDLAYVCLRFEVFVRVYGFFEREHLVNNRTRHFWMRGKQSVHIVESGRNSQT